LINLNKIKEVYNNLLNNFLYYLGVNIPEYYIINPIEELTNMEKTELEILTEIVVDNHEEEFRILDTGDDAGSHFALYVPVGSETTIIAKEADAKIKKSLIIIITPPGYIGTVMR
jgi:hypothetical protein